ncbi:YopR family T3SS polymerization control protein [Pseudomonas aeruginosa]|uniref:YopR family T3SS polymerization control protein n=11 Tax=Pseudomonas aeruginosa TaxID=287 RepID=UPI00104758E3
MDTSLIRELAELALAGSGQHCHEEALCIAEWLERLGQDEAARLIRISSLANQGRYQEALAQALGGEPPAAGRRLAGLENGALGERLLQRFAQPLQGLEADRLELKAMLRAELPLGRQQQTFLLQLLGAVEHAPGGEYLAQLARRELQVLIPLNGMLDNLVRNSHKLDLES